MSKMYMVLPDDINSIEKLDSWMDKFNSMTYYQRMRSNDMSIAKYGQDNIYRYNELKAKLNSDTNIGKDDNPNDLSDNTMSSLQISNEISIVPDKPNIDQFSDDNFRDNIVQRSKEAEGTGLIILIDTDSNKSIYDYDTDQIDKIRNKYQRFIFMPSEERAMSNQTAQDITGFDNYNLYAHIIDAYNSKENKSMINTSNDTLSSRLIASNSEATLLPYFTLSEINEFNGKYSSSLYEDPYIQEFTEYYKNNHCIYNIYKWFNCLESLYILKDNSYDVNTINSINESILHLGWNPEIPFTRESAIKASRERKIVHEMEKFIMEFMNYEIVDLSYDYLTEEYNRKAYTQIKKYINKSKIDTSKLSPVFMVFTDLNSTFNKLTKVFTKSEWSHATMSFSTDLSSMYSFNRQGFVEETINTYLNINENAMCKVYAFMIDNKARNKMLKFLKYYKDHQSETKYSIMGIINLALNRIDEELENNNLKLICSQFVYMIMKIADLDIDTNKTAAHISPKDLDEYSNDDRLFTIYEGPMKDYDSKFIDKIINRIKKK